MIISSLESGQYVDVNDSFAEYTGYERHELIGRSSLELSVWVHSGDRDRFIALLQEDGYVTNFEAPYRKKDGTIGIGLVSSQFITLNNENCLLSITRDITDYKHTQRLLTLAEERAAVYYEFLTHSSHELRTPISIIDTSLYIAKKTDDDEKRVMMCQKISKQTTILNQMFDNLIILARLDIETETSRESVHPTTIVKNISNILEDEAKQNQVSIHSEEDDSLPHVLCNIKQVVLALYQILKNAIDHSPADSVVHISSYREDNNVVFEIRDQGTGIDQEALPQIFDRFFRADESRTKRGLGVGLSIAQKIADLHSATIRVNSHDQGDTSFQFILPLSSELEERLKIPT